MTQTNTSTQIKNIILVHGAFVDGSGWGDVYKALKKVGYAVSIIQNPTVSLTEDVAATKRAIAAMEGPVILAGHSYGGVVITEAGNDPKVAGLVYIAAFALDNGESVSSLLKIRRPARPCRQSYRPRMDSYWSISRSSRQHLQAMWIRRFRRSWLILRSRGVSTHSVPQSLRRRGGQSRVGIW